jgi:CRP-like cAMP-binding protein
MAADGKDALVGLLGDDIDSMIDSIIDDVGSSISSTPAPAPKAATRIPLFSDLTANEFVDVAIMLVRRSEKAGTVIVTEGAPGDSMFIISTGEVEATKDQDGEAVKLATLQDGDFFGEMAVLSGEPRSATVTAVKNTELLELSRSDLNVICSRHPEVEAKLRLAYDERSMRNQ